MTKILLVEDNEMNRDMLSRRLKRKGYEIVFAVSGPEAGFRNRVLVDWRPDSSCRVTFTRFSQSG